MAMEPPAMAGVAVTVLNSLLLAALAGVWLKNYWRFRSSMLLGLVTFSAVLLVEHVVALVFFFSRMGRLYSMDPLAGLVVLGMRLLTLVAVGALAVVTMR
ncbi:hypothetical protein [Halovenus halobia]|uniref:hypothetical protein n=1 Tax=Halovenus halobia TaxID=3396622 RepID=UPI003F55D83E